ncbi:MAG: type 4a pilus biogenesis protein PilO [Coriobacteriia bacterium]|nr:type 4a pilus biogenesis protein PilO [Coriobacteriia bacterium]
MKLTSMQKVIFAIAGIVIVCAGAIALFIVPMFTEIATLDGELVIARQQKEQALALLAQLEQAKVRASETQSELLRIATQMPDSPQLPSLIIEMQEIASAAGMEISVFSPVAPGSTPNDAGFVEIQMNATMLGTYSDLIDYVRRLHKSARLIRVASVQIAPQTAVDTTVTASAEQPIGVQMVMKAYVLPASVQPAAGAVAAPGAAPAAAPGQ